MNLRGARRVLLPLALWTAATACQAGLPRFCDRPAQLSAAQQDRLLRVSAIVKAELDRSGHRLALMSRSGLDLSRLGVRYSHAGFSLQDHPNAPWSVRQLYYACDEQRPRLFDQGVPGFLLGTDDPSRGYLSLVFLPPDDEAELARAALDPHRATGLLAPDYSANAHAYGLRYQNCNQWLVELIASARGRLEGGGDLIERRAAAQRWLRTQGYQPSRIEVGWRPLMWLGAFVPWLHDDDHPDEDLAQGRYQVSMPAAIEAFVQATVPGATRMEFCHTDRHVLIRHGWSALAEGCVPQAQDTLIPLD
ncbi:hypothetical protein C7444_11627 [Sphaerotilus hippei]|uniref:DUF2145 domain-containing protein n=1 Tax=Sphaerotilus hippei TaxID=744406 RepID=A0A318GWJ5_9BURK|nr:DUF2145 domain-containing protein [Sphaerotilus hippei]PXW93994.1 hypothetical protein C7444_11627 [Sphaerotilus hippei]